MEKERIAASLTRIIDVLSDTRFAVANDPDFPIPHDVQEIGTAYKEMEILYGRIQVESIKKHIQEEREP